MEKLCDFDCVMLWKLRNEIPLCSLFYSDYRNSFGIDEHEVFYFFDGYADYLSELMMEDGFGDDQFYDRLDEYDNADNLWDWFCSIEFEED